MLYLTLVKWSNITVDLDLHSPRREETIDLTWSWERGDNWPDFSDRIGSNSWKMFEYSRWQLTWFDRWQRGDNSADLTLGVRWQLTWPDNWPAWCWERSDNWPDFKLGERGQLTWLHAGREVTTDLTWSWERGDNWSDLPRGERWQLTWFETTREVTTDLTWSWVFCQAVLCWVLTLSRPLSPSSRCPYPQPPVTGVLANTNDTI